ncbi:hypothetical protein JOF46_004016 [Paeniglutamicibacter psychrophenolicus]|uniref:PH domain-containing protein n=1 Tax=Paeniglutamicibacter psychrophenolicus TaxID=257454 RepID=A0ABS4WKK2_9MICC|nr:hypothetical protein [Paeniglutamicibacter psychrophenolicus]
MAGGVRTSSDDVDKWMRSINAKLGFLPAETEMIMNKERARDQR